MKGLSAALANRLPPSGAPSIPRSFPLTNLLQRPDNLLPLDLTQLLEFKKLRRRQTSESKALGTTRSASPELHTMKTRLQTPALVEDYRRFPHRKGSALKVSGLSSEGQWPSGWCLGCSEGASGGCGSQG